MSRQLIYKNGRTPKFLLICGIVCVACGIFLIANGAMEPAFGASEFEEAMGYLSPILALMLGAVVIMASFAAGKTNIYVFDDHIEGVGIGKGALAPHNFYFSKDMHYTVQTGGMMVRVSCGGETYSVSLSKEDAQEVYRCVYGGASTCHAPNPAQQSAPGTAPVERVIAGCPGCGTKCRVPAGKGLIRVTCPKCKVPFTFNS